MFKTFFPLWYSNGRSWIWIHNWLEVVLKSAGSTPSYYRIIRRTPILDWQLFVTLSNSDPLANWGSYGRHPFMATNLRFFKPQTASSWVFKLMFVSGDLPLCMQSFPIILNCSSRTPFLYSSTSSTMMTLPPSLLDTLKGFNLLRHSIYFVTISLNDLWPVSAGDCLCSNP